MYRWGVWDGRKGGEGGGRGGGKDKEEGLGMEGWKDGWMDGWKVVHGFGFGCCSCVLLTIDSVALFHSLLPSPPTPPFPPNPQSLRPPPCSSLKENT